ncbi:MAG: hypothetical protein IJY28_08120 [Clostridia bacterium]|nr:hypothetical protein [Clostridia bacterium]
MQQKMMLRSVRPVQNSPETDPEPIEAVLLRGILMAFAAEGLLTEQQARKAIGRMEREVST